MNTNTVASVDRGTGGSVRAQLRRAGSLLLVVVMALGLVTATGSASLADDVDVSDSVDAAGQRFRSYDFTADADGTVAASLGWAGTADLALYVRRVDDAGTNPVGPLLSVSKTSVQPEQFSFVVDEGDTYRLIVEAISGSATYELTATLQSGDTRTFLGTADLPGNAVYRAHPISIASPGMLTAELAWDDPSADLGLYLRGDDGTVIDVSRSDAPSERLSVELDAAGDYEYLVRAESGATSYTLDVDALQTGEPRTIVSSIGYQGSNGGTQVYDAYDITSSQAGTLVATLESADDTANLDLFARPFSGGTLGPIAASSATSVDTEQLSVDVTAGQTVRLLVKATSGDAPFTLSTDLETGTERTYRFTSDPASQNWRTIPFEVPGPGALSATLTGDGVADLQLYLRRPDGSLGEVLKTDAQPEVFTHDAAVAGTYELIATSASGATPWTLETRYQDTFERELVGQVGFTSSTGVQAFESYDVTAPEDGRAVVRVAPTDGDADLNLYARRIDDPGAATPGPLLATSVTSANPEALSFPVEAGTGYRLYVEAASGASHFAAQVELDTAERPTLVGTVDAGGQRFRAFEIELASSGELSASLAWADGSDLALFLQETDGTTIASSVTGDNPETLTASVPAGTYRLNVRADAGATAFELDTSFEAGGNVAPFITVVDSASVTETIEIDPITVEVTDPDDEPTVTVDGLPAGLSFDRVAGEITGAPDAGTAADSPYTVVVTADDGVNDAVTAELELTVEAAPAEACSPLSPLPCGDLPVALPFALDFTGDEGGLGDTDGDEVGFTLVDPPSERDDVDQAPAPATPSDPDTPGYEPSLLDVDGGNLTVTATKGIQFAQPTTDNGTLTSTQTNGQLNGLGVAVPTGEDTYELTTTLVAPEFGSTNSFQQGGLWWFVDEDTYVKLAVQRISGTSNKVQLAVESLDAPTSDEPVEGFAELSSPTFPDAQDVSLRMEVDAANGVVRGFYSVAGGAEAQVVAGGTEQLVLPDALVDGVALDGADAYVNAGLFATKRRADASSPMTATFADFGVTAPEVSPVLAADPTSLAFTTSTDTASATFDLTSDGDDVDVSVINDQPWITAVLLDGATATPATVEVTVDPDGLTPGDYSGTVTVLSPDADDLVVGVDLTVEEDTTAPTDVVLDATAGDGQVELAWTGGEDATDVTFDVFRSETSPVDTSGTPLFADAQGGAFLDTGLTNDTTVFYVVTATDEAGNTTASNEVEATPTGPAEPCSPISPLPCADLVVPTPFALTFDGGEGGLSDTQGEELGFTLVDAPSNRDVTDQAPAPATPTDPDTPGYEPSLLDVDGGELTITATKGINYAQLAADADTGEVNSTETNSQLNGLGVAVEGGQDAYELTTTVVAPDFAGSNNSQQAGLWWFVSEDVYVKLVTSRTGPSTNRVELAVESLDDPFDGTNGFESLGTANIASGQDVALRLEIDAANGVARGFYSVAGGAEQAVTAGGETELAIPTALVDGVVLPDGDTPVVNAGLFASKRRAPAATTVTATFAGFGVTSVDAPDALEADPAELAFSVLVDETDSATVDVTSTGDPASVTIATDEPWLDAAAQGAASATPLTLDVTVDADGLAADSYDGTVTVSSDDAEDVTIPVTLTVTEEPVGDVALSVNFQSETADVPTGHVRDFGQPYGPRTDADQGSDLTYGWVEKDAPGTPLDLTGNGRDRDLNPDQRLDTLMHMQLPGNNNGGNLSEGTWQLAVPNGTYDVTVAVGDPSNGTAAESHTVNVEGTTAIDGFPKSSAPNGDPARHEIATVTVTVADGQLTVDPIGGTNTKINYLEVTTNDGTVGDDPVFIDVVDRTVTEGQLVLVPAGASDPDGGDVDIALTDGPAWLAWDATDGRVEGTVPTDVGGTTATVELTATDDEGATATESFDLTIEVALDLAINFQPAGADLPAGFLRDSGDAFAARTGADQGSGLSYGWVTTADGSPVDLSGNTRDRGRSPGVDQLDDTIIHTQYGDTGGGNGNPTEGAWEIALPEGAYRVSVTVGDQPGNGGVYDSTHAVNAESHALVEAFQSTSGDEYGTFTGDVGVLDGRLTLSPVGGTNTKLTNVEITSLGQLPFVTSPIPANRADDALLDTNVSGSVSVPGAGVGVDPSDTSLNETTVKLFEVVDGGTDVEVSATRGSTGGNDTISVAPDEPLKELTTYRFVVDGALDENGYTFLPFTSLFTTGEDQSTGGGGGEFEPVTGVDFEKVDLGIDNRFFTSLVVHEGYLWATTVGQGTFRYEVLPDGTLGPEVDLNLFTGRAAIGFVFDEADPTVAWFTHATANTSSESQEFGSKVSRVDFGTDLDDEAQVTDPTVDDVFVNLPRSLKDHLSNSMAYGPSGDGDNRWLYFLQGSNQAAGDIDSSWGPRTETVLTAAVLRFDPVESWADAQANGPIDVQTEDGGTYDPYAPGAPLEVYATGIRNAYDLVFHSNGSLYVPTNGTAGGGTSANSPGVEIDGGTYTMTTTYNPGGDTNEDAGRDLTDICLNDRIDGQPYSGGEVPAASHPTQRDFLFDVVEGGYYGHPNPERCEFVLNNGGDPIFDGQDGTGYGPSVDPDPNYRGFAYDFTFNKSPNGAIEYQSSTFGGALQGRLMVVRFSGNNDILTMQVDTDGTVLGAQPGTDIGGFAANYNDPLDVTEDTTVNPGNLYLNQYARSNPGAQKLFLLRVPDGQQGSAISVDPEAARLSATLNNEQPTDTETVTVTNDGSEGVTLTGDVTGGDAADFEVALDDTTLAAGASMTATITFDPTGSSTGTRTASLELTAGDDSATVELRGLAFQGQFGGEEPTLQEVVDVLEYGIDTGWSGLAGGTSPTAQGDEVLEPLFEKAGAGDVTMTPVAAFAPFEALPFGWYVDDGTGGATLNEVGVMASGQQQTLDPTLSSGGVSFDPGTAEFGTYYFSNTFNRTGYTEDARNDGDGGVFHRARIYPLSGDRFLVAFEDASNGDYQDYVFVLDNVVAADGDGGNGGGGGTGDALMVNFQSETAPVPAGHVRDFGEAYGARSGADQGDGLVYGWVDDETFEPLSLVGNGRDRDLNDDQRLDTLMHMDLPPDNAGGTLADGSWELAVDNGTYEVTVSVGDPDLGGADETHTINIEGITAIAGFPKSTAADGSDARHDQATVTVEVLDGKLTVDQDGGTNTKINYVEVTPSDGGGGGDVVAQVNFQPPGSTTPQGWEPDTGELFTAGRGYGWVRTEGGADKTGDTRDRAGDPDPLTATTIIVDDDEVASVVDGEWELALADGTYTVEVSVGDAGFGDSTHTVLAEGTTVVDGFVPTGAGDYGTGSADVEVTDGFLTVASGGGNTKIQWIRVTSEGGADTVPPRVELEVTGDQLGDAYVDEATVTATVTDATLEFNEYVLDGGPVTAYTEPVVVTGVGEHTFELTATDGAGNTTVESVTFDIVEFTTTDGELTLTNPEAAPFDDRLVMSRIQSDNSDPAFNDTATLVIGNDGTEDFDIVSLDVSDGDFEVTAPTTLPVTVPVGDSVTIEVLFTAVGSGQNQIFESDLLIGHEAANGPQTVVELAGMWQAQSEGGNEPNVVEIVETFGFGTTIVGPGQQVNNQGRLEAIGDEVLSQYWERADKTEPVTVRQLAAYHSCCNNTASFRWHVQGQKNNQTTVLAHDGAWAQSLLPRINGSDTAPALASFTPSEQVFGLRIDPESSDWELNDTGPDQCGAGNEGCQLGHHLRVWPAEDRDGVQVADLWIVVMDYSGINYDFNDNVYLVSNITPAGTADTTPPDAPEGLTALGGDPDVALDWTDNSEDDLAGYHVERSTGGAFSRITSSLLADSQFTDTTAPAGTTVTYRVVAVDDVDNESDPSATASIDTAGDQQAEAIRINAGGPAITDLGFDWEADRDFANGKTATNAQASVSVLYQSERSATADLGPVDYAIAVPDGTYDVELHLAETYFGAPGGGPGGSGQRVFSANLEGGTVELVDYDLIDEVGSETAVVQTYRVEVTDGVLDLAMTASTNRPTISGIAIVPVDPDDPDPVVARINAGGPALTDLGVAWEADRDFSGGKSYTNAQATVSPLYQTERSATSNLQPFAYDIPVADGTYEVRLHLAEIYFGADGGGPGGTGQRVFSANIEGGAVELADYDINADVGPQTETVQSFTVTVTDGNLDIDLTATTNQAKVSAIEVLAST